MSNFTDVLTFHRKMGLPVGDFDSPQLLDENSMDQRMRFMREELNELQQVLDVLEVARHAKFDMAYLKTQALPHVFDALLDLVYVACGTAVMMGLPWEEGWDLVQAANMKKEREEGKDDEHHRGVIKPMGWQPPDLPGLLEEVYRDGGPDYSAELLEKAARLEESFAQTFKEFKDMP